GTTYSGPIGAVITPHMRGMKEYKHLSYASTLSGACTAACPVKINLHELLLANRHESVEKRLNTSGERIIWMFWKRASLSRKMMNMASGKTKNKILSRIFGKAWGERRQLPEFAPKSFNQLWEENNRNNE